MVKLVVKRLKCWHCDKEFTKNPIFKLNNWGDEEIYCSQDCLRESERPYEPDYDDNYYGEEW